MTQVWTPAYVNGAAAQLWYAPVGTAKPAPPTALYPTLPSPWINPGGTVEGFEYGSNVEVKDWNIEEQDSPVKRRKRRTVSVKAELAEATLDNYKLAQGGGKLTTTAAAGGAPAFRTFTFTDDSDEVAICLDSIGSVNATTGVARALRLYVPRCDAAGTVTDKFRRIDDYRHFTLEIAALCPGSQIELTEYDIS